MSNNRLYAVCKICNNFTTVAHYDPEREAGWDVGGYFTFLWFPKHQRCLKKKKALAKGFSIDSGDHIAFVTEDDGRVKSYDFENEKIILRENRAPEPMVTILLTSTKWS